MGVDKKNWEVWAQVHIKDKYSQKIVLYQSEQLAIIWLITLCAQDINKTLIGYLPSVSIKEEWKKEVRGDFWKEEAINYTLSTSWRTYFVITG